MSARFLPACLISAALLTGILAQAVAQAPDVPVKKAEGHRRHAKVKLVQRVYPVADLIIPQDLGPEPHILSVPKMLEPAGKASAMPSPEPATKPVDAPAAAPKTTAVSSGPEASVSASPSFTSPCVATSQRVAPKTTQRRLMKLIQDTVQPKSWHKRGGQGTITYYPLGMALVVNQKPDVQEQIADLLATLRRLQDVEVAVEVRFLKLPQALSERIGLDFSNNTRNGQTHYEPQIVSQPSKPFGFITGLTSQTVPQPALVPGPNQPTASHTDAVKVAFLNDRQVFALMEAAQADPRTSVMQLPKLTVFNGQNSSLSITDQQYFVTSMKTLQAGGQVVFCPQNEALPTGLQIALQPVVSADRRFVRLSLQANLTDLATPEVPLFPITTFLTPIFEGGAVGQPIPFTQFLQQPKFTTTAVKRTLNLPDGGTALLGGFKRLHEGCNASGTPVLSRIPYLNRLFKNVGPAPEPEELLMMVTPRIIINEQEEAELSRMPGPTRAMAASLSKGHETTPADEASQRLIATELEIVNEDHPASPKEKSQPQSRAALADMKGEAARLLEKYNKACSEGRLAEAKNLASQALDLDPACFSKNRRGAGQHRAGQR